MQSYHLCCLVADKCGVPFEDQNAIRGQIRRGQDFVYHCCPKLGFSGVLIKKGDRIYVGCDPKDETPELRQLIDETNEAIIAITLNPAGCPLAVHV